MNRRIIYAFVATAMLLLCPQTGAAQQIVLDSIVPRRIVVKTSSHGFSLLNNLDTYLSGYNHTGVGYIYNHENFRDARIGNYKWKYQTLFNVTAGYTKHQTDNQLSLFANRFWSGYHPFAINDRLQLLAGAQIQLSGGALYIPTNGNNLVSAKLRLALAASGMAIYHIPIKGRDYVARYQLDVPLAGVMFSPEFGQSYYEIFGLGHFENTFCFANPINSPSWRHTVSFDIPIGSNRRNVTLRVSYIADLFQSKVNDLRTHIYNHAFTIGFVKTIYKIKQGDPIKAYSPY